MSAHVLPCVHPLIHARTYGCLYPEGRVAKHNLKKQTAECEATGIIVVLEEVISDAGGVAEQIDL